MLDWFVQAYQRGGDSFKEPIPFTSAAAAINTANAILGRAIHERVRIYHAAYVEVRLDLTAIACAVEKVAETLEAQARLAAEVTQLQVHFKRGGPKH